MKKLIITMSIVLISLLGYSQATNVGEFRIANATTAFGVNLPIGTKVYDITNNKYYVATAGVASTATLTTASASFSLLNDAGTDDQTAAEVSVSATGNLASTDVQAALVELQGDIDGISDTDDQTATEVNITDAGDYYTGTTVEAALTEIASAGYLTSEVDGSTTNEIQTLDESQLNGTTLELSLSSDGEATKEIDLSSLQDGTGTDDQTAAEVAVTATGNLTSTNVQSALAELQGDIDGNASDISDNTSDISTNSTNIGTNTSDIAALESLTSKTDNFEVAADDLDGSDYTLTQTAKNQYGIQVSINGALTSNFSFASNKVTLSGPVYKYDQIVVMYTY